jgi:signal transduction histidine kinase
MEFQHRNPAGDPTWLAVTISPIIDPAGRRTGISVYVRDVTRRMDLERDMAQSQKMSALGALAGQVAHHFNNVLGGIITSLDFALQTGDDPDTLRRAMRTAVSSLTRASSLTQGLLVFAEGTPSDSTLGDLTETVRRFAAQLQPKLAAQDIRFELDLEPVHAWLPVKRIQIILENLTANSREAMPDGGALRIELRAVLDEPKAVLRVADTGCGICPEDLPRVFEPFFTTKCPEVCTSSPHAGLGLAVVHGIVKEMGGSVTLCSTQKDGTVCSVSLPLSLQPPNNHLQVR